MAIDEIKTIRQKIREQRLSWSAGSTPLSDLPLEMKKNYLGLVISEEERARIVDLMAREDALAADQGRAFIYPAEWDWRWVLDKNWTTPIRDQGGCGSCVAFATLATIESNLEIFQRNPGLNPDLSEADLFFRGCGNCCGRGWNFAPALSYAQSAGVPDEACWPYDSDQARSCSDRDQRIIKIESWKMLSGAAQAKEWISRKGPVMSGLHVYEDFYYYTGGVYKNAYGSHLGDHAICIVGYSDAGGYWICKNSWGTGWGENGWFKIAFGECSMGGSFGFYAVQFTADDDLIMPMRGRVVARLRDMNTAFQDEIWMVYPEEKMVFSATEEEIGRPHELGTFSAGSRITLALKSTDGLSEHIYYTDQSLNDDACDHVKKVQTGTRRWELRWEDIFGLAEKDYSDVVMDLEVFSPYTDDLVMPKDGRVFATLKSRPDSSCLFSLSSPQERKIFTSEDLPGKMVDLGTYAAGKTLCFSMQTPDGHVYFTDYIKNPDGMSHVRKLPTAYNKWELRWEESLNLKNRDYKDLIVTIEVVPTTNEDVVLPKDCKVTARFVSRSTPGNNQFWLHLPTEMLLFDASAGNVGKSYEVGEFSAGTRLVFSLLAEDGNRYFTDSSLNPDARAHVLKLPLGANRCQLRWEDLCQLKDRDYNDLVVEIIMTPK